MTAFLTEKPPTCRFYLPNDLSCSQRHRLSRSILVRLLKQNLLIGASVVHSRVDQYAENKDCKRKRENYGDPQPAIAQCTTPIKSRASFITGVAAFLPSM
jgi:hypothetical protein